MRGFFISLLLVIPGITAMGQTKIKDEAMDYQHQRMVYMQWDKDKFKPDKGFLGLSPLYIMTWWLHPNYPKTDKRVLSASGPQTQRIGLTAAYTNQSDKLKLESDTVRQVAESDIARTSGAISGAEPLWILYYKKELDFPMNASPADILKTIPPNIYNEVLKTNAVAWYTDELGILRERIEGAKTSDMDRGSRILAYHRLLLEYRTLQSQWINRLTAFKIGLKQDKIRKGIKNKDEVNYPTGRTDKEIGKDVASKFKPLGTH